jgi:hypothetical protein
VRGIYKKGQVVWNSEPASAEAAFWTAAAAGAAYKDTRGDTTAVTRRKYYKWSTGDTVWVCTTAGTTAGSAPSIVGKAVGDSVVDGTATFVMVSTTSTTMLAGPAYP